MGPNPRLNAVSALTFMRLIRCISPSKWLPNPRTSNLSPVRASSSSSAESAGYGGWYNLRFGGSSYRLDRLERVDQLLQFIIGGLSGKKVVNSKPNKVKDNVKQGTVENAVNDQNRGHNLSPREEERFSGSLNDNRGTANSSFSQDSSIKATLDQDGDRRMKMDLHEEK
ncbi:hypothetical protein QYF36_007119 [Acer negundo]|nr:hypothetical protein QYF36_007119 [Acer negundo]